MEWHVNPLWANKLSKKAVLKNKETNISLCAPFFIWGYFSIFCLKNTYSKTHIFACQHVDMEIYHSNIFKNILKHIYSI